MAIEIDCPHCGRRLIPDDPGPDPGVKAYVGQAPKIDSGDHLDGSVDPASRRGAFGYEYHGHMPKRR